MITFYADAGFVLDLTDTKITLVEENPLFYNYFIRNYTWPFRKKIDDETSKKLGFIDLDNVGDYEVKFYGKLLIDDTFDEAFLLITDIVDKVIEGSIYYGRETLALLDKPLNELPFPVVNTDNLRIHARSVIDLQYPEVGYNFPMIIDQKFSETSKYEKFEGFINNYRDGNFVNNTIEAENIDGQVTPVVYNRNLMVPFPYLMEILRVGFASENMVMLGSFVSDQVNEKLMVFTEKYLEKFQSSLPDFFQFTTTTEIWDAGIISASYSRNYAISLTGSYKIKILINIPVQIQVHEFKVLFNLEEIYSSDSNVINEELTLNVENDTDLGTLRFSLDLRMASSNSSNSIGDISAFNSFNFQFSDGQLNIFPNNFSLAEIMPDMTFGAFLNKIKNWLNLEVLYHKNTVIINYIESKFLNTNFKDESHLEIEIPKRKPNHSKLFKLTTGNGSLFISKNGLENNSLGYREEDIIKIDMGLELMPIESFQDVFTAVKKESGEAFKLFLYDGLQNDLPVSVSSIFDRNYLIEEVHNRFWKQWLLFRLNSELYTDKFPLHISEPLKISEGSFKYNKKHIFKKIKKRRKSEEEWDVEVERESFS
jgi:hypothetical protein